MDKKNKFELQINKDRTVMINENLFKEKKLNNIDLCKLKHHYKIIYSLFDRAENSDSIDELKEIAHQVELSEFMLQKIWKFKQDKKFHKYWFQIPKCKCPKIDNMERVGTGYYIFNNNCPIHGNKL